MFKHHCKTIGFDSTALSHVMAPLLLVLNMPQYETQAWLEAVRDFNIKQAPSPTGEYYHTKDDR